MTSKQLLKAAKQFYYHKQRLGWIQTKITENQATLVTEMLTKGVDELVVSGFIVKVNENKEVIIKSLPAVSINQLKLFKTK